MRVLLNSMAAAGVVSVLAACDPVYRVGARQYLALPVPVTDSASGARADRRTPSALDVPRTADCLDTALRASPAVSDARRTWGPVKQRQGSEVGMGVAISDPALGARPNYANLHLRAWRNERPMLEVVFLWIGSARTYPVEEQRAMVRVTTALLQRLRAACVPEAPEAIECVAEGLGGHPACSTAH